ncbi:MAG: HAMP domain-containing histidine kinase [Burkholderiaceae bacterium]|jgi:two-component system OmpR family sensor kinase|nr:HAMP domain-containing histidine kinase [Burkholderiaceae bacterium]
MADRWRRGPVLPPRLADQLARDLTLALAAVWLVCVLALAWYVSHIVHRNFDQEMMDSAHRLLEVAVHQLEQQDHSEDGVQRPHMAQMRGDTDDGGEDLVYQLQNQYGDVLLRTQAAPVEAFPVPMREGFYERQGWRMYVVAHPRQSVFLTLADPLVERRQALQRALLTLVSVMLVMLALMGWALRVTARRRLRVLRDMQLQLSERGGTNLEALDLLPMPRELWRLGRGINHLMQRLSYALQTERSVAANAAHELRTPLAVATLRLRTALDTGVDNADVRAAHEALERLRQRTEKLLQLSRAASGSALAQDDVRLDALASTVAAEFWQQSQASQLRLDVVLPEQPCQSVSGDVDTLAIALRNLVENALRYSGGAEVVLEVCDSHVVQVRDDGPGMARADLVSARERHVRHVDGLLAPLHGASEPEPPGYGLGLSIVSMIVAQHGGHLELQSPVPGQGRGLLARIQLPRREVFSDADADALP